MDRIVEKTLFNLNKHYFDAHYFESIDDLKSSLVNIMNTSESFAFGGSATVSDSGLKDFIISIGKKHIERAVNGSDEDKLESERMALMCDVYFSSSNAISSSGALINIDKRGNRIGAMIFGPKKVVIISGTNKIVDNVEEAVNRAKNISAVKNCRRFNLKTPCTKLDKCIDCEHDENICYTTTIIKRSFPHKRISVFLLNGEYGF